MMSAYPILPEPEAHIIAGVSMGAGAAFNKAIKYPERFKAVLGVFPPVKRALGRLLRPLHESLRSGVLGLARDFSHGFEVVARFFAVITIRQRTSSIHCTAAIAVRSLPRWRAENPIEMLRRLRRQGGSARDVHRYAARTSSHRRPGRELSVSLPRARPDRAVGYDPTASTTGPPRRN